MSDDREKYIEIIRKLIPICELPAHIQNELVNSSNILKVKKKGFLFKQGERDDYSYYLLEGEIELHANDQLHNVIEGGSDRANYAMAQLQPRQFSARAKSTAVVFQLLRNSLDKVLVLQEKDQADSDALEAGTDVADVEFADIDDDEDVDWMTRMLQSELFSRLATANIHQLFAMLEAVEFKNGGVVINQGEVGEHYYIIQEGSCQVTRKPQSGGKDIKLASLKVGDSFGEEALITETTRNASVSMLSDGVLMRLSKDEFVELIKKPTLHSINFADALSSVDTDTAIWLDVRFKNEHEASAIDGSLNVPLNILRMQLPKLEKDKQYIVYCDTGGRSSAGAFLMTGDGFDVSYLEGGLVNNPQAAEKSEVTQIPQEKKELTEQETGTEAIEEEADFDDGPISSVDEITKQDLDPEVKASVLEAELARKNMQLKDAEKVARQSGEDNIKTKQKEVEQQIQEERAKIEAAKKSAEEEAKKIRAQEELKIKQMQERSAKRLEEETKKMEEIYTRNTEEMEKLQRMKQEAEEDLKKEREILEKETEAAKKNIDEARKLKKEIESSKRTLEKESLIKQKQQEEMEKKIQEKAREKLEAERKKMAQEFARNQADLERAKSERVAADAARKAAKAEAEKIIAEFKMKHAEDRAEEEQRIKEERLKLEEEQRKIQETLKQIQEARQEAEAAHLQAVEEAQRLRVKQVDKEITQSKHARDSLKSEIKAADSKINKANKEIHVVQQEQQKVEVARKVNAEDLELKKEIESKLQQQLAADLEDFREEQEEQEKGLADAKAMMQHMKRIKEKAEMAKKSAQKSDLNLLDEVSAQLDEDSA